MWSTDNTVCVQTVTGRVTVIVQTRESVLPLISKYKQAGLKIWGVAEF